MVHPPIAFGIDWIGVGGNTTPPMVHRPTRLDKFSTLVGFSSRFKLFGHSPIDSKILLSLVASPGIVSVEGFTDTRTASLRMISCFLETGLLIATSFAICGIPVFR